MKKSTLFPLKAALVLFVFIFFLAPLSSNAGTETSNTRISGTAVKKDATFQVKDNKYPNAEVTSGPVANTTKVLSSAGKIIFSIDHASPDFIAQDYKADITMEATSTNKLGQVQVIPNISLTIEYKNSQTPGSYKDKEIFIIPGSHLISVRVTSMKIQINNGPVYNIPGTGNPAGLPLNYSLEAEIETERLYNLDRNSRLNVLQVGHNEIKNCATCKVHEIEVYWDKMNGAEEYDLEWTFINDYADTPGSFKPCSALLWDFRNNATRISTSKQHYRIPLMYEHGYIIYRVRGVGRHFSNPEIFIYNKWSSDNFVNPMVSGYNHRYPADCNSAPTLTEHEKNKNWQSSSTFAEEGKSKNVITYADGTLRSRQQVTKSNTRNEAIAGETVYDHQGRAAIEILPVPLGENEIKYHEGLNRNSSGIIYGRNDFDIEDTALNTCGTVDNGMSTTTGSSKYYSDINPDKEGYQGLVPDAKEFPFTQVEYTPDNTGRIRRQSAPGLEHRMGNGHETKYLYGQPEQVQLDRLFGSEVGYFNHYLKNATIDPNGQINVSYIDPAGRTIATSLAGNPPAGMEPLPGNSQLLLVDFLKNNDPLLPDANEYSGNDITFSKNLLVTTDGDFQFNYNMDANAFQDNCTPIPICYDCIYKLKISLVNDCGEQMPGFPVEQVVGTVNPFDTICGGNVTFQITPAPLTTYLNAGNYTLVKTLTIDQAALEFYLDNYIANNSCVNFQSYLDSAMAAIDTTGCDVSCEDCVNGLGVNGSGQPTSAIFIANGGTQAQYDAAVKECRSSCTSANLCQASYEMMLSDVSPGGQYAKYGKVPGTDKVYVDDALSVLNFGNILPGSGNVFGGPSLATFRKPQAIINGITYLKYFDEDGQESKIPLETLPGGGYAPSVSVNDVFGTAPDIYTYAQHLSPKDFILNFRPSWAKSLVTYHPEYCYYNWCIENSNTSVTYLSYTSDGFDDLLRLTGTRSEAVSLSLLGADNVVTDLLSKDPYFASNGQGASQYSLMESKLTDFTNNMNIKESVAYGIRCQNTYYGSLTACYGIGFGSGIDAGILNKEWVTYRNFYLSLKQQLQQEAADEFARGGMLPGNDQPTSGCYNGCIGIKEQEFNAHAHGLVIADNYNSYNTDDYPSFTDQWETPLLYGYGFYDPGQACYFQTHNYYRDRIKRFGNSNDFGSDEDMSAIQNQSNYDMYSQTGQCNIALQLEWLLNALTTDNNLTNQVALSQYNEFTNDLYDRFDQRVTKVPFINYYWSPVVTGTQLQIQLKENSPAGAASACQIKLTLPSGYNWSNVVNINALYFQQIISGEFHFTCHAWFDDDGSSLTPLVSAVVNGETCIPLSVCEFDSVCTPSSVAGHLQVLFNTLVSQNEFASNADLNAAAYTDRVTPQILVPFALDSLTWSFTSATPSYIGKISDGFTDCSFEFAQSDLSPNVPSDIIYFSDITPDEADAGAFFITAHLTGGAEKVIHITTSGCYYLGKCHEPIPTMCKTAGNFLRMDLLEMLDNVVSTSTNGFSTNNTFPVYQSFYYTDLIDSYLEKSPQYLKILSVTENSNEKKMEAGFGILLPNPTILPTTPHATVINDFETECDFVLEFDNASSPNSFSNITGFSHLEADAGDTGDPFPKSFTILAHFSNGSIEALNGYTSCFPLQNCVTCATSSQAEELLNINWENGILSPAGSPAVTYINGTCPAVWPGGGSMEISRTSNADVLCMVAEDRVPLYTGKDRTDPGTGKFAFFRYEVGQASTVSINNNVPVTPNTDYIFSAWYTDAGLAPMVPVTGKLLINNTVMRSAAISDDPGIWKKIEFFWNSGSNTSADLKVAFDLTGNGALGLDDIVFASLPESSIGCPEPPPPAMPTFAYENPCAQYLENIARTNALNEYENAVEKLKEEFRQEYLTSCRQAQENFNMTYTDNEYHFTLYYYDQPGNLIKTVPPLGVIPITAPAELQQVKADRFNGTHIQLTQHSYATRYEYNSLDKPVMQDMPDHQRITSVDYSIYSWYDKTARPIATQNAKQYYSVPPSYSYTLYDALGRIIEVGEAATTNSLAPFADAQGLIDQNTFISWLNGTARTQITKTKYDLPGTNLIPGFTQENLRSRVSLVSLHENISSSPAHATHYSYDIHGNVKTIIQDNPALAVYNQRYKRIDYKYDLVSGNVNEVKYQKGQPDAFYHKYWYDADNRLSEVFTSRDEITWDKDAKYFYYAHGPLARVELGDKKVQGIDYAYTLQGWIKGVNSNILEAGKDIGKDGTKDIAGFAYSTLATNLNAKVSQDAYSYTLGYYQDDYAPIKATFGNFEAGLNNASYLSTDAPNLYNGNIKHMVTTITPLTGSGAPIPQLTAYKYDQLNRIRQMKAYRDINTSTNSWGNGSNYDGSYETKITYDANGNIDSLKRNGWGGALLQMDELKYVYENMNTPGYTKNTNKLRQVKDNTLYNSNYGTDIDNQDLDNYTYDAVGNLISDVKEGISGIEWNTYGKISKISKAAGEVIEFKYDANGNRVMKIVKPSSLVAQWEYTFYILDAKGVPLIIYSREGNSPNLKMDDIYLYGSVRLGMQEVDETVPNPPTTFEPDISGDPVISMVRDILDQLQESSSLADQVVASVSDITWNSARDVSSIADSLANDLEQFNEILENDPVANELVNNLPDDYVALNNLLSEIRNSYEFAKVQADELVSLVDISDEAVAGYREGISQVENGIISIRSLLEDNRGLLENIPAPKEAGDEVLEQANSNINGIQGNVNQLYNTTLPLLINAAAEAGNQVNNAIQKADTLAAVLDQLAAAMQDIPQVKDTYTATLETLKAEIGNLRNKVMQHAALLNEIPLAAAAILKLSDTTAYYLGQGAEFMEEQKALLGLLPSNRETINRGIDSIQTVITFGQQQVQNLTGFISSIMPDYEQEVQQQLSAIRDNLFAVRDTLYATAALLEEVPLAYDLAGQVVEIVGPRLGEARNQLDDTRTLVNGLPDTRDSIYKAFDQVIVMYDLLYGQVIGLVDLAGNTVQPAEIYRKTVDSAAATIRKTELVINIAESFVNDLPDQGPYIDQLAGELNIAKSRLRDSLYSMEEHFRQLPEPGKIFNSGLAEAIETIGALHSEVENLRSLYEEAQLPEAIPLLVAINDSLMRTISLVREDNLEKVSAILMTSPDVRSAVKEAYLALVANLGLAEQTLGQVRTTAFPVIYSLSGQLSTNYGIISSLIDTARNQFNRIGNLLAEKEPELKEEALNFMTAISDNLDQLKILLQQFENHFGPREVEIYNEAPEFMPLYELLYQAAGLSDFILSSGYNIMQGDLKPPALFLVDQINNQLEQVKIFMEANSGPIDHTIEEPEAYGQASGQYKDIIAMSTFTVEMLAEQVNTISAMAKSNVDSTGLNDPSTVSDPVAVELYEISELFRQQHDLLAENSPFPVVVDEDPVAFLESQGFNRSTVTQLVGMVQNGISNLSNEADEQSGETYLTAYTIMQGAISGIDVLMGELEKLTPLLAVDTALTIDLRNQYGQVLDMFSRASDTLIFMRDRTDEQINAEQLLGSRVHQLEQALGEVQEELNEQRPLANSLVSQQVASLEAAIVGLEAGLFSLRQTAGGASDIFDQDPDVRIESAKLLEEIDTILAGVQENADRMEEVNALLPGQHETVQQVYTALHGQVTLVEELLEARKGLLDEFNRIGDSLNTVYQRLKNMDLPLDSLNNLMEAISQLGRPGEIFDEALTLSIEALEISRTQLQAIHAIYEDQGLPEAAPLLTEFNDSLMNAFAALREEKLNQVAVLLLGTMDVREVLEQVFGSVIEELELVEQSVKGTGNITFSLVTDIYEQAGTGYGIMSSIIDTARSELNRIQDELEEDEHELKDQALNSLTVLSENLDQLQFILQQFEYRFGPHNFPINNAPEFTPLYSILEQSAALTDTVMSGGYTLLEDSLKSKLNFIVGEVNIQLDSIKTFINKFPIHVKNLILEPDKFEEVNNQYKGLIGSSADKMNALAQHLSNLSNLIKIRAGKNYEITYEDIKTSAYQGIKTGEYLDIKTISYQDFINLSSFTGTVASAIYIVSDHLRRQDSLLYTIHYLLDIKISSPKQPQIGVSNSIAIRGRVVSLSQLIEYGQEELNTWYNRADEQSREAYIATQDSIYSAILSGTNLITEELEKLRPYLEQDTVITADLRDQYVLVLDGLSQSSDTIIYLRDKIGDTFDSNNLSLAHQVYTLEQTLGTFQDNLDVLKQVADTIVSENNTNLCSRLYMLADEIEGYRDFISSAEIFNQLPDIRSEGAARVEHLKILLAGLQEQADQFGEVAGLLPEQRETMQQLYEILRSRIIQAEETLGAQQGLLDEFNGLGASVKTVYDQVKETEIPTGTLDWLMEEISSMARPGVIFNNAIDQAISALRTNKNELDSLYALYDANRLPEPDSILLAINDSLMRLSTALREDNINEARDILMNSPDVRLILKETFLQAVSQLGIAEQALSNVRTTAFPVVDEQSAQLGTGYDLVSGIIDTARGGLSLLADELDDKEPELKQEVLNAMTLVAGNLDLLVSTLEEYEDQLGPHEVPIVNEEPDFEPVYTLLSLGYSTIDSVLINGYDLLENELKPPLGSLITTVNTQLETLKIFIDEFSGRVQHTEEEPEAYSQANNEFNNLVANTASAIDLLAERVNFTGQAIKEATEEHGLTDPSTVSGPLVAALYTLSAELTKQQYLPDSLSPFPVPVYADPLELLELIGEDRTLAARLIDTLQGVMNVLAQQADEQSGDAYTGIYNSAMGAIATGTATLIQNMENLKPYLEEDTTLTVDLSQQYQALINTLAMASDSIGSLRNRVDERINENHVLAPIAYQLEQALGTLKTELDGVKAFAQALVIENTGQLEASISGLETQISGIRQLAGSVAGIFDQVPDIRDNGGVLVQDISTLLAGVQENADKLGEVLELLPGQHETVQQMFDTIQGQVTQMEGLLAAQQGLLDNLNSSGNDLADAYTEALQHGELFFSTYNVLIGTLQGLPSSGEAAAPAVTVLRNSLNSLASLMESQRGLLDDTSLYDTIPQALRREMQNLSDSARTMLTGMQQDVTTLPDYRQVYNNFMIELDNRLESTWNFIDTQKELLHLIPAAGPFTAETMQGLLSQLDTANAAFTLAKNAVDALPESDSLFQVVQAQLNTYIGVIEQSIDNQRNLVNQLPETSEAAAGAIDTLRNELMYAAGLLTAQRILVEQLAEDVKNNLLGVFDAADFALATTENFISDMQALGNDIPDNPSMAGTGDSLRQVTGSVQLLLSDLQNTIATMLTSGTGQALTLVNEKLDDIQALLVEQSGLLHNLPSSDSAYKATIDTFDEKLGEVQGLVTAQQGLLDEVPGAKQLLFDQLQEIYTFTDPLITAINTVDGLVEQLPTMRQIANEGLSGAHDQLSLVFNEISVLHNQLEAHIETGETMTNSRIGTMQFYRDEAFLAAHQALGMLRGRLDGVAVYGEVSGFMTKNFFTPPKPPFYTYHQIGRVRYELYNHLGNVNAVVSDRRIPVESTTPGTIAYYTAELKSSQDYYAGGMLMPNRNFSTPEYKYGFNGKENDNEVHGVTGSFQDYGMRMYDTRLGRFISVDPLTKDYPWYTPYQFAGNDVIRNIDREGMEPVNPAKPGENKNGINTTAIDNARAGFTPQYHMEKTNASPFRGEIKQFEPNSFESLKNTLNKPSDNGLEASGKFIGRFVYNIADDAFKYSSALVLGANQARDLAGTGINQTELQDAGISTLLNTVPIKNFGKLAAETKTLNAAQFSKKYKGTEFLKGSAQERGAKIVQENLVKKDIVKSSKDVGKVMQVTGGASQVKQDNE